MRYFTWDNAKNEKLKSERNISFEDVVFHVEHGGLLDVVEHPDPDRYFGQKIMVVSMDDYAYLVPYEEFGDMTVLRTIIPSRRMTRKYLSQEM